MRMVTEEPEQFALSPFEAEMLVHEEAAKIEGRVIVNNDSNLTNERIRGYRQDSSP